MSIYVVGESLGRGGTRAHLARLLGLEEAEMMAAVVWINLWEYPGTDVRRYVDVVERVAEPGDAILLLGRRVARAFRLETLPPLGTLARSAGIGPVLVAVPHPSGRNRWYNDPDHAEDASAVLRAVWRRYGR